MIVWALLSFSILKGVNAVAIKLAQKDYVRNSHDSIYLTVIYSLIQLLTLFILPPYRRLDLSGPIWLYPTLYAIVFFIGYVWYINALRLGPVSLTNIIYYFQILVPVLVGVWLWKETISVPQWIGLLLFCL